MNSVFKAPGPLGQDENVFEELFGGNIAPRYARGIKKPRLKRGHGQKDLARISGISESALRSYDLGARKSKPEVQERIAMAWRLSRGTSALPISVPVWSSITQFSRMGTPSAIP